MIKSSLVIPGARFGNESSTSGQPHQREAVYKRGKLFVLFGILGGLASVTLANPFNFFVRQSERFSLQTFGSIRPGTPVEDAVVTLGAPIEVVSSKYALGCMGCKAYYFLAARGGIHFAQNWVKPALTAE